MKQWAALLVSVFIFSGGAAEAQTRGFAGLRLVSRELRITSTCLTAAQIPSARTFGPGVALVVPELPPCEYLYPNGTKASPDPSLTYTTFQIDHPTQTPPGTLTAGSGSTANVTFDRAMDVRLRTSGSWMLNPPAGQTPGTHTANYSTTVEGGSSDANCAAEQSSGAAGGALSFDTGCPITRMGGRWEAASETAQFTIVSAVTFRFGNNNGSYTVTVRANYEFVKLEVDHIEVLQTVQTADNRVPLVAEKLALVRVFPVAGSPAGVQVRLRLYRGDVLEQTIESGAVHALPGAVVRNDLMRSANFLIPAAAFAAGDLRLEADLKLVSSSSYFGLKSQPVKVEALPAAGTPFPMIGAILCESAIVADPVACGGVEIWESLRKTRALLPVRGGRTSIVELPPGPASTTLRRLFRLRAVMEAAGADDLLPRQYVAHEPSGLGDAWCPEVGPCAVEDVLSAAGAKKLAFVSASLPGNLTACAVGANLGLERRAAAAADPGLTADGSSLLAASAADFMSCAPVSEEPVSVSADNATRLFRALQAVPPTAGGAPGEPVQYTIVSGTLNADAAGVTFAPLTRVSSNRSFPETRGEFCLRSSDAEGGAVGSDVCFGVPNAGSGAEQQFAARMILPASARRIALLRNGAELGVLSASAGVPEVTFTAPESSAVLTGRFTRIGWRVNDSDPSDEITSDVWASTDEGATWTPLAFGLTNARELVLDTLRLGGAASNTLLVQVRVSDGFHTAMATLGPLTLAAAPVMESPAPVRIPDTRLGEGRVAPVRLQNSGAGTLRITSLESSSAAFTVAASSLPFEIGPQQSADLPVYFSARELGAFSASLTLRTNDPALPVVITNIAGDVYEQLGPAARVDAMALDFGAVNINSNADRSLRFTNRGNAPLSLTNITALPSQFFRVVNPPNVPLNPGSSLDLIVRCNPSAGGYNSGALTIATNDPTQPAIQAAMGCTGVTPALEVPTQVIEFGTVANGQSRMQQVTIRNLTATAITINSASSTNSQFRLVTPRLPYTIPGNSGAIFDLQFSPTVAGVATAVFTLESDRPGVNAQMQFRGTGTLSTQSNGRLTVEPAQLTFGEVIINQSRTLTLALRNTGTGLLTVTSVTSNNQAFTISGASVPLSIPVGATVEAQVRFSPATAVSFNSILVISSDSVTGSDLLVTMTGTGLPIPATTVSNLSATLRQEWNGRANLTSFGPDEAILRFVRFDSAGVIQTDTGLTIPPGAQLRPEVDGGAGWVQVRTSKGSVQGFLQFSAQQAQTFDVLPLNPVLSSRYVMTGLERGSDIILNNLVSDNNPVVMELRSNNGALAGTYNETLTSRATIAQRVEQLFANLPQGFQGYVTIAASQPLQATRANNGVSAMEVIPAQPSPAVATRTVTLHAPRIQAGNGWLARLQVVNPTDREARITIRSASGEGVSVGTPVSVTVPAGSAYWREYTQIFELAGNVTWNASLTVESSIAGVVAEVSYGNSFARAAYALAESVSKLQVVPYNTASTTFYVLNPNTGPVSVDFRNLLEDGTFGPGRRVTIPRGGYYGAPSGLIQSPAIRMESDFPVVAHATIAADQVADFGVLPALILDGGSTGGPAPGTTPRLQVDPATLDFGNVVINQNRALTLMIRNGGSGNLTITSMTSSNARFVVEANLPLTVLPGGSQSIPVRFTPTAAGPQTGTLTVNSNDSVTGPVLVNLNGAGTAVETPKVRIEVTPTSMDFGDVGSGQTKDLQLTIRNGGTDPLVVSSVTFSNSRFQVVNANFPLTVIPSGLTTVVVRFSPPAAGLQTGTLTVASNDSANPAVTVSLRGTGVGVASSPQIYIPGDTALEFGVVPTGQTGERTFEIRNRGTAPLVIQSMVIDNPNYTVGPPAPFTVAPNAIADIGVLFKPKEPGNQPATLRITSNDPVNALIVIPITGAGQ